MANDVDLSSLIIEVDAEAKEASKGIDAVASALSRLNASSKLTKVINSITKLSDSLTKLSGATGSVGSLERVVTALNKLSAVQKPAGLTNALNSLKKFPDIVAGLNPSKLTAFSEAMQPIANALSQLSDVQKLSGLNSAFNTLQKLPKITESLDSTDLEKFAGQLERVRAAIAPLASEMQKVSSGFSALPNNIQRTITAIQKVSAANRTASSSFKTLGSNIAFSAAKFTVFGIALQRIADYLGDSIVNFNAYVENVNLFSVSMGEFTPIAAEFTQALQDILGVDASGAMRNMGVIQNLTTSFGVAADQAYILSKNITQLGYDFASFFNISTEEAFTKLQAAISGELEPIRRLGVDISEARLQQELFALGVNTTVENLSQADKSLLRYIAIMKQTGNAQTDMARTLDSPANAVRVLQAQLDLFSRSLGSLFIPALNTILPYLTAFTMVAREAVTALAALFGVTVEFADATSSVSTVTDSVGNNLDNVADSATAAAKAVAYLIGGFDELNVLPSASSSGGGSGSGSASSVLGDVSLPEYDIFEGATESKAKELAEQIKKIGENIVDFLKPAIPVLEGVGAGLAAMFIVKKVSDFIKAFSGLKGFSGIIGGVSDALLTFNTYMEGGYGFATSFSKGIGAFRESLSTTTKVMLGVGGFVAVLVTAYETMKNFKTGTMDAYEAMGTLVGVAGLVGTALTVALGPIGLVITAVGLLAGGYLGLRDGAMQLADEIYQASDAYVVINQMLEENEEITSRCDSNMSSLNDKLDHLAELDAEWAPIRNLVDEVYRLSENTNKSAYETEFLQAQVEYLNGLGLDNLQLELDETGTAIVTNKEYIYDVIDAMEQEAKMAALQDIITEAYKTQYQAAQDVFTANQNIQASQDLVTSSTKDVADYLNGLTEMGKRWAAIGLDENFNALWKEMDGAKESLASSQEAYDTARQTLSDSSYAVQMYTDELVKLQSGMSDTEESAGQFSDIVEQALDFTGLSDEMETQGEDLGENLISGFTDGFSSQSVPALETAFDFDKAEEELQSRSYGLGSDVGAGMSEGLEDSLAQLDSSLDIISKGIISGLHNGPLKFGSPSKTAKQYGEWFVQGLSNGITAKSPESGAVFTELTTGVKTKLANINQTFTGMVSAIISTLTGSFKTQWNSGWTALATAVKTSTRAMNSNLSSGMNTLVSTYKDGLNKLVDYTNTFIKRFNRSMKLSSPGIELDGQTVVPSYSINLGKLPTISKLASGGVLTSPQLVLAGEYATANTNPEIVSPRSLMYDTVVEANEVMVIAIVAAIRELQRTIEDKDTDVVFSPSDVGKAAIAFAQQQKRRTGKNPFA